MRVLVVGSLRSTSDPTEQDRIRGAARELGQALAERGHTILIGSEDGEDVDPAVFEGAANAKKPATIEVHLMAGAPECYAGRPTPPSVLNRQHRYSDWDVTVLEVLRKNADAVLAIAGRVGVVQTGLAAWMLGRPVLAIATFGGGAQVVWGYGSGERTQFYFGALTDEEIDGLSGAWRSGGERPSAPFVVDALERVARAARRAKTPKLVFVTVSVLTLLMLMLWVALLSMPLLGLLNPVASHYLGPTTPDTLAGTRFLCLLVSVCSAGALGALMQTLRGVRDDRAVTLQRVVIDGVLGIAAGFLAASLYLVAQIAITGKLAPPETDHDYARVALIVGLAALFSSLYLDAALARFDSIKESVMSGEYGMKPKS